MIQLLLWSFWLNLFFFSLTIGIETIEVFQDTGDNVTLHCPKQNNAAIQWVVSDVNVNKDLGSKVQDDGSLWIRNAIASDSHLYTCQDSETNQSLGQIKLTVRTVPPSVSNLTIITHSVYALVTWTIHGDGGYPINRFILKYRPSEIRNNDTVLSQWKSLNVDPKTTSVTIYQLQPNRTYYFRLFSVNQIGASQEVTVMAKTKFDLTEIKQANELLSAEQHESSQLFVRVTITAVCLVVVTFAILALGISLVLFRNCGRNVHTELNCEATEEEAEELMELVPHITLNPSFNIDMLEYIEAEVSPTDACERTNLVQVASNDVKSRDVGLI